MKQLVLAALSMLLAASAVQAQPFGPPGGRAASGYLAEIGAPETAVRSTIAALSDFVRENDPSDRVATMAFLERQIAPQIDFDTMARRAAGPMYRGLSPAQRNRIRGRIKEHFLGTLAGGLMRRGTANVRVVSAIPGRFGMGRGATVTVYVGTAGRPTTRLDFRLYPSQAGWKVYDVSANGRSATLFYRDRIRRRASPRYR